MIKISFYIDKITSFFAKISAASLLLLALLVFFDALMRYLFHSGSIALQELEWHLFDMTFLLSGAYALKHNKHVRVDIFYDRFPKKIKDYIDFFDNLLLIAPFTLILLYYGFDFTLQSFFQHEGSSDPGGLCCRYLIKALIPLFAFLLFLQSFSELVKLKERVDVRWALAAGLAVFALVAFLANSELFFWVHPALLIFLSALMLLLMGFRVAFVFAEVAVLFAVMDVDLSLSLFEMLPMRIYGIMQNFTLMAVPLFILMGLILERSEIAKALLENIGALFGKIPGGLAVGVVTVGAILAAATGIVGASVVMMSVITLPIMIKHGYDRALASGTIAASGTLGQIIPPSIVLIVLGDVLGVSVGELFKSAVVPGLLLVFFYILYIMLRAFLNPKSAPPVKLEKRPSIKEILYSLVPATLLIFTVLGSIFAGIATPTESAAFGVVGAFALSYFSKSLNFEMVKYVLLESVKLTAMIFTILIGATAFSLVFNSIGGEELVREFFSFQIADPDRFILISMLTVFILGFFIDFVEISFVVIPMFVPILAHFGIDPVWFGVMVALNLQASFLTPPFGFSLFYLKGSAKNLVSTADIYRGVVPFIVIQIVVLVIIYLFPQLIKV